MKYVRENHARKVIDRAYPDAANVRIMQKFTGRHGWLPMPDRDGTPLRELPRLCDTGVLAVQLRLITRCGRVAFPDYQMHEFEEEFRWEVGDRVTVNVNQGDRDAYVVAVVGTEAMIEYEMPGGTSALWVINAGRPHPCKIRGYSYKSLPRKWRQAIEEAGVELVANGQ
jgi:hypothetical protein